MAQPPISGAQKLAALRELLPATGAGIYLDTATAGPLPAETAAAMREAEDWELRVGRAVAGRDEDVAQRAAEARAVVAALIGGDPAQVGLAVGLEQALEEALSTVDWRRGDRLAASELNDTRVLDVAASFARRRGLEVDLTDSPADALTSRTRLALVPDVAPRTGARLAIDELAHKLEQADCRLVVDASCSAGAVPFSVATLAADAAILAADRWALGPEATAAFWFGPRSAGTVPVRDRGGLARTTLLGLARSVGWLAMYVGLEWAIERTGQLARWLAERLAAIEGVELVTPADAPAAIVTFRLPVAWRAEAAADELGRRVFAILRPLPELGALRASVAWFNTEQELERFVAAVAELAAHTPETLPRRPALTVL